MILTIKNLRQRAEQVQDKMDYLITHITTTEMPEGTRRLKEQVAQQGLTDEIVMNAYALMGAAIHHITGKTPYLVQIMAALVLNQKAVAEMYTGEGKTLTALMPLYANALVGKGAHLITANPYLAKRDADDNRPVFEALGMTVGYTSQDVRNPQLSRKAYQCDVTYTTGPGVGFDYLHDNTINDKHDRLQRGLYYALIDEADSILLDEAKTPLIISGHEEGIDRQYQLVNVVIADWVQSNTFAKFVKIDKKRQQVTLKPAGVAEVKREWGADVFEREPELIHVLNELLLAYFLYKKNVNYVITPDKEKKINTVQLIDSTTGRITDGQRLQNGLHQALETKENLLIQSSRETSASITYQALFQLYDHVAGMTGTAKADQVVLSTIYGLETVTIPTNRPRKRIDLPGKYFRYAADKDQAVLADVKKYHGHHQPILLVTGSVEQSEHFDRLLNQAGYQHYLLTAKNPEVEAQVVSHAGERDSILVSTNMAGRGTDIKINEDVEHLGGLVVLGTEYHESIRVDDQLRGRAGRQGQPGITQFYGSLEDDLFKESEPRQMRRWRAFFNRPGKNLNSPLIRWFFKNTQKNLAFKDFTSTRNDLVYQSIIIHEQQLLYRQRDWIMDTKVDYLHEWIMQILKEFYAQTWYLPAGRFKQRVENELLNRYLVPQDHDLTPLKHKKDVMRYVYDRFIEALSKREDLLGDYYRTQIRELTLTIVDRLWQQELQYLQNLKQMVIYESYRQANPTIEYQRQANESWERLLTQCRNYTVQAFLQGKLEAKSSFRSTDEGGAAAWNAIAH